MKFNEVEDWIRMHCLSCPLKDKCWDDDEHERHCVDGHWILDYCYDGPGAPTGKELYDCVVTGHLRRVTN